MNPSQALKDHAHYIVHYYQSFYQSAILTFPGVTCFTLAYVQYESECPKTTIILTPKHRSEIPTEGRWVYDYDTFESEIEVKPYDGVHFIFD